MMHSITGVRKAYDTLNKVHAKCLVCGAYSECQIMHYGYYFYFLRFRSTFSDEQFWFTWAACHHRAILYDKPDIERYRQEQVETGILSVPYYSHMKLNVQVLRRASTFQIILLIIFIVLGIAAFVGFAELLKVIFHVHFILI
jgi:hypothetical protein